MGLFSKIKKTPKALPNQADKYSEPIEYKEGYIIEYYKNGKWIVGEVCRLSTGRVYISSIGNSQTDDYYESGDFDMPTRRTKKTFKHAIQEYNREIARVQDIINHKNDLEQIKELRAKIRLSQRLAQTKKLARSKS